MIRFEHVTKVYESTGDGPDITALHDVNLHIRKGEFVFVLGHSGAGKSTFLKLILREEVATEGRVLVNRNDLSTIRQRDIPYLRRGLGVLDGPLGGGDVLLTGLSRAHSAPLPSASPWPACSDR